MTGIERLYKLIADIDVSADPELWYILRGGTEGDWDCEKHDDKTLDNTLAAIANQIEREQRGRVSRMRVLAVVMEMERHVSGVEGMEDSPVARWARELREALGDDVRDPAADVSVSAYDLLPQEDRDALAWVRDHGGLDAVKRRWECLSYYADPVPRSCMEKRLARLQRQIDESHAALRRRNQRIEELGHRVSELTTENTELRRRAMPEGYEWPRFEDGEKLTLDNAPIGVEGVEFPLDASGYALCCGVGPKRFRFCERVRRPAPKVLDADGEPLKVGQTVWDVNGDELVIGAIEDGGHTVTCRYADVGDGIPTHGMWSPSDLTHRAPVLAADGRPLREGETVWDVETGDRYTVDRVFSGTTEPDFPGHTVACRRPDDIVTHMFKPSQLTHTKPEPPDSWERIEEDAKKEACAYFGVEGCGYGCSECPVKQWEESCDEVKSSDLVRRCRALAERERGE